MTNHDRWWTIRWWGRAHDGGVKIGPISIYGYLWDGPQWGIALFNRAPVWDSALRALAGRQRK